MPEEFTQRGGGRIGRSIWWASNATWPFASLKATRQSLTLHVSIKQYTFERDTIRQLKRYQGVLSTGLRIIHTRKDYPPFIVFWSFDFMVLKSELQRLGYDVEDNNS